MQLNLGTKGNRVLSFIYGLRDREVAATLAPAGFTDVVYDEGWDLLQTFAGARTGVRTLLSSDDLDQLDALENRVFPIVKATLARHYPAAHDTVFLNLEQTSGRDLIVTTKILLDRVGLVAAEPDGPDVLALLEERGLTTEVVSRARELLARLTRIEPQDRVDNGVDLVAAEEAMWAWYLEWSAITRALVVNRGQLRQLGFLRNGRSSGADNDALPPVEMPVDVESDQPVA
jgi:hypothetical protein